MWSKNAVRKDCQITETHITLHHDARCCDNIETYNSSMRRNIMVNTDTHNSSIWF